MLKQLAVLLFSIALLGTACSAVTAPVWQHVGNTGAVQTTFCIFDHAGDMYCGSNRSTGAVYKSTDQGVTWTKMAGLPAGLYRGVGLAPDGTVFTIQQINNAGIKAYWLNNVNGNGLTWTPASIPYLNYGMEQGSAITADNTTVVVPTGGGGQILLSTDNARSWHLSPHPLPTSKMAELLGATTAGGTTYVSGAVHSGTNSPCCDMTSGMVWKTTDNGNTWTAMGWPSNMIGCKLSGATKTCSVDAGWVVLPGVGAYSGNPVQYIGATGNVTGMYCWQGSAWVPCNTNQWLGKSSNAGYQAALNRTHTTIILIYYEDDGAKPVYLSNSTSWYWSDASTGLTCVSKNCGTYGGPRTSSVLTSPTTGHMFMVMKDGEVWRTTASMD